MEFVRRELKEVLGEGNVLVNEPMSRHTTFCVGGPADLFLKPGEEELPWVMELLKRRQIPVTVIGKGSNLLVGDKGVRGAVIEVGGRMAKIRHIGGECITAQAGAPLARVAQEACKKGLSGLEFAAGIPGGIGGAIVMNAGAYGGEMKDIVTHVKVLDGDGNVRELSNRQMEFAYRNSCVPKNGYLVLEASFRLQSMDEARIRREMEELREQRMAKQPLEYPSAGSTFKRPEGHFAGKLIMDAGLSGYSVGGAQVSKKHCGFVINRGDATAGDIRSVIRHVQETVKEKFGVDLNTEVKMLGEFS